MRGLTFGQIERAIRQRVHKVRMGPQFRDLLLCLDPPPLGLPPLDALPNPLPKVDPPGSPRSPTLIRPAHHLLMDYRRSSHDRIPTLLVRSSLLPQLILTGTLVGARDTWRPDLATGGCPAGRGYGR